MHISTLMASISQAVDRSGFGISGQVLFYGSRKDHIRIDGIVLAFLPLIISLIRAGE